MAELLIREVEAARNEMCAGILKLIVKFENDSEMRVEDINLRKHEMVGEKSGVVQVTALVIL